MASKETKPTKHDFLLKSGTVFRGRVQSETKTAVVLELGGKRGIVTLAKSGIATKDGAPWPPAAPVEQRKVSQPLVLTHPESEYPIEIALFFDAPLPASTQRKLDALLPAPLRFQFYWATPQVLSASTYEYPELDVRIAYNAKARALFAKKKIAPFASDRYDILVNGGIDNEPSEGEMRAFVKDVSALIAGAHATKHLSFAYVSYVAGFGALERAATTYAKASRAAAVAWLTTAWSDKDAGRTDPIYFRSMSYMLLFAIAHERLTFDDEERVALSALFDRAAAAMKLDKSWRELRQDMVGGAKPKQKPSGRKTPKKT